MGMVFWGWTAVMMQKILFFSPNPLFFRFVSELPSNFAHVNKNNITIILITKQ